MARDPDARRKRESAVQRSALGENPAGSERPDERKSIPLWGLILGVWVTALCIRCLCLWQIHSAPFFDLRIGDAAGYHQWARRIASGDWLGTGVFYQAPLYPYFLAIVYRIFDDTVVTVRVIQAVIGATSCALLAAAGILLFGRRGAIAGLGLALYPTAIFLDGLLEKSALVTFFTIALIALLSLSPTRMSALRCFATGSTLALLTLTRENALILSVPVVLWIFFGPFRPRLPARFRRAAFFIAGGLLVLVPVGLRNLALGGEFVLTTSQFGSNLYIGNHAGAKGVYEALVAGHGSVADEREDAIRLAEQATTRKLTPSEVSRFWTGRALEYIWSQPVDWFKLMARKLALAFNAAEMSDTESQDVYAEWSWLLRFLGPFDFGVVFGLAAAGVVLTSACWRRWWFLYAFGGTYALSVALFYVFARYRFPLVPVLMILAAGGLVAAVDSVSSRRTRRLTAAIVVGAGGLLFAQLPLDNPLVSRATHYAGIASALAKEPGRTDDAMRFYRRALEADPRFPGAQFGLGTLLARIERPREAVPYYQEALASWPQYEEAHYNLAMALAATGRAQEASREFAEALRLRPDDADAHIALAKTLIALNHPDQAVEHYEQGLAARPEDVTALVGFGVALAQLSRTEEAIPKFRRALEIDPQNAAAHNSLGSALASQGRIAEALPHFERAAILNPNDESARRNLETARRIFARTDDKNAKR